MRAQLFWLLLSLAAVFAVRSVRTVTDVMVGGGLIIGLLCAVVYATWRQKPLLVLASLTVCVVLAGIIVQNPRIQARVGLAFTAAAMFHRGQANSYGWHYLLLDPDYYVDRGYALDPLRNNRLPRSEKMRYVMRAAASVVLVPLPWTIVSRPGLAHVPEQVVWYALLVLAAVGIVSGIGRDVGLTFMLLGVIIMSAAIIALTSGNVGTLIRHRSVALMLLPWLSGMGVCALIGLIEPGGRTGACEPRRGVIEV